MTKWSRSIGSSILVTAMLVAGCDGVANDVAPDASTGLSGEFVDTVAMKPPLVGLVDMGYLDFAPRAAGVAATLDNPSELAPYASSFVGTVVNLDWAEMEPTQGAAFAAGNPLDVAMQNVIAYNKANPHHRIGIKLRIAGGFVAPDWAKNLGGAPITLSLPRSNGTVMTGTVGRWWSTNYINAWRSFQTRLAAQYDISPLIAEVAVTSCAASTDEPFVPVVDQTAIAALHTAGYTDVQQQACLRGAVDDYSRWRTTWIDYTFNNFLQLDTRPVAQLPSFTQSVMATCTTANHCILATHYLDDPLAPASNPATTNNLFIYDQIIAQEQAGLSTADFQTVSPNQIDWCGAMEQAHAHGGMSVELWPRKGFTLLSAAQVTNLAATLTSGTRVDASLCPPAPTSVPAH